MALKEPLNDGRLRLMATILHSRATYVRNRMEYGGPLTAQEIIDGVRLSHEEFIELVELAMPEINHRLKQYYKDAPTSS